MWPGMPLTEDEKREVEKKINRVRKLFAKGSNKDRKLAVEVVYELGRNNANDVVEFLDSTFDCIDIEPTNSAFDETICYALRHFGAMCTTRLSMALTDVSEVVRRRAAKICGLIGGDARCIEEDLVARLSDESFAVCAEVAKALGLVGGLSDRSLDALAALTNNPELSIREAATHALANAVGKGANPPVEYLPYSKVFLAACESNFKSLRHSGIHGLNKLPITCDLRVEVYRNLLLDQEVGVDGYWIGHSIRDHAEDCDLSDLVSLICARLKEDSGIDTYAWCEALEKIGRKAKAAIPILKEVLARDGGRIAAANALWKIEGDPAMLIPFMLKDFDDNPEGIADLCCLMGRSAVPMLPKLLDALSSEDWDTQWAVGDAIGFVAEGNPGAIPALIEALNRESPIVLGSVSRSLAKVGVAAVPELLTLVKADDLRKRNYAVYALGQMGPVAAEAAPLLKSMLTSSDSTQVQCASVALALITKDPIAVPYLLKQFDGEMSQYGARLVLEALGKIGPLASEAIPTLDAIIRSSQDEEITALAREVLNAVLIPQALP